MINIHMNSSNKKYRPPANMPSNTKYISYRDCHPDSGGYCVIMYDRDKKVIDTYKNCVTCRQRDRLQVCYHAATLHTRPKDRREIYGKTIVKSNTTLF